MEIDYWHEDMYGDEDSHIIKLLADTTRVRGYYDPQRRIPSPRRRSPVSWVHPPIQIPQPPIQAPQPPEGEPGNAPDMDDETSGTSFVPVSVFAVVDFEKEALEKQSSAVQERNSDKQRVAPDVPEEDDLHKGLSL